MWKSKGWRKVYILIILLILLVLTGTIGYHLIEHYTFLEALFMTIITIATVGFNEVHPLSSEGMIFTVFLIVFGFGIFAYVFASFTELLIEGVVYNYFKIRKMQKKIDKLKEHVILCGYGRNGKQVTLELIEHKIPIVVIENDPAQVELLKEMDEVLYIEGDATQDEVLINSGIERASSLIASLSSDAQNVFLVLTARELNPKIKIISKASDEAAMIKLQRAGANNVIMTEKIGGRRMARLVAKPDIVEFIDYLTNSPNNNTVILEEVSLEHITDYLNGRTLREFEKFNDTGVKIIGIKIQNKSFIINPLPETVITPRDKLFVLGTKRQIKQLYNLISDNSLKG